MCQCHEGAIKLKLGLLTSAHTYIEWNGIKKSIHTRKEAQKQFMGYNLKKHWESRQWTKYLGKDMIL